MHGIKIISSGSTYKENYILYSEVKWAVRSTTTYKASGDDGIPAELFKNLKDDAVKVPHSISFKIHGEIKSFSDKQKLREFSTTKLALQQTLKGLIQSGDTREEKNPQKQAQNH